jgi:hypothetical protein
MAMIGKNLATPKAAPKLEFQDGDSTLMVLGFNSD